MSRIDVSDPAHARNQRKLGGHPIGLYILFFTELWERFSYYGMRAILVLFLVDVISGGGMGWSNADALGLYGWYTMAVYVASIPGGILADRLLGQKKTVMLGGLLLCAGHLVLAIPSDIAFFCGLGLIVLGVGGLKPNISTMVGGLYKQGDASRDQGFTIFYIGINIGAFLAGLVVASVAQAYGWHAGFGLAGIGMLVGQAVYMMGQRYLKGVGDYEAPEQGEGGRGEKSLTKVEKDRIVVLLLSFLIIIVFWGAFEQAGGLMNLYAQYKTDRVLEMFNFTVPAGWFQSVNSFFIITLGTAIGAFWIRWRKKGREASSLFKMAWGTIIMGLGFLFMAYASVQAGSEPFGKAGMIWLVLAYLLHTIGELSASPVSLSFITKLAPAKYAAIMMGCYFAATGFGNKVAGTIGEASQPEPIKVELTADGREVLQAVGDSAVMNDESLVFQGVIYPENGDVTVLNWLDEEEKAGSKSLAGIFAVEKESKDRLTEIFKEGEVGPTNPYHFRITMEKDKDAKNKPDNVKGDGKTYEGDMSIEEVSNQQERKTFLMITIFTAIFGILLLIFLKKLKALTHNAEEVEESAETA